MAGLVATVAAVVAALAPLTEPDPMTPLEPAVFRRVYHGPQEQLNEFPCAEVIFGPGTITRNQPVQLERQSARSGVVRVYARRNSDLPAEFARLAPLVDAVTDLFGSIPHLDEAGSFDRFDATGYGAPGMTEFGRNGENKVVVVDVSWQVTDAEADTYVQDW